MKMKCLITFFISFVMLFFSCKSWLLDEILTLPRKDYIGNELRTDGYYYVSRQENHSAVYFLYRNGIVLFVGGYSDQFEEKMVNYGMATREQCVVVANRIYKTLPKIQNTRSLFLSSCTSSL